MVIHIVEQGETIQSISNEYGVSAERLISDNGLFGLKKLVVGQALIVLQPSITYTVLEGDTLYSVSNKFNISVENLKQRNTTLAQLNDVTPGEVLTIEYLNQTNLPINIYGFLYPTIKDNVLSSALPFLGSGGVFSYGSTLEGELIELNDSKVINTLLSGNTSPIMVLTSITEDGNFDSNLASELFNNTTIQNVVINNIIRTMYEKGYTGLDIDFEFIKPQDKESFVNFVKNVTTELNKSGFSVNVDLAPKTSSTQSGALYEGHDYKALGSAANTVLVMSYEWGYTYSEPMAVAPINQVRRVLEYALTEIPNNKIYMGIPNYGYDWKLPYEKGVTRARLIGNEEAISIAAENNAIIKFNEISQTPYFTYIDGNGSEHEVWFEDIRSIIAKFNLVEEFNLKGVGYWNLMRKFNQNWTYIGYRFNPVKPGTPLLTN